MLLLESLTDRSIDVELLAPSATTICVSFAFGTNVDTDAIETTATTAATERCFSVRALDRALKSGMGLLAFESDFAGSALRKFPSTSSRLMPIGQLQFFVYATQDLFLAST